MIVRGQSGNVGPQSNIFSIRRVVAMPIESSGGSRILLESSQAVNCSAAPEPITREAIACCGVNCGTSFFVVGQPCRFAKDNVVVSPDQQPTVQFIVAAGSRFLIMNWSFCKRSL